MYAPSFLQSICIQFLQVVYIYMLFKTIKYKARRQPNTLEFAGKKIEMIAHTHAHNKKTA